MSTTPREFDHDGAVIADAAGGAYPWIRTANGLWARPGLARPMTWDALIAWHQGAVDDPNDDTTDLPTFVLLVPRHPANEDSLVTDDRVAEVLHLLTNEVEARSSQWEEVRTEAAFKRARRIILNAFGLRVPLDVPEHVREGWRLGMLRNTHKVPLWHTCPNEDDEPPAPATEHEAGRLLADMQATQRALDNTPCRTCGGDRLRPDYRTSGLPCHAPSREVSQ